jgi:ADP-ribosyl-[dinitrogen reductase] hydrolase
MTSPSLQQRYAGSLIGLACGDAVGTTVEFRRRGTFVPVRGMTGGGPFGLAPGRWTDDTSMALCLCESLLERNGFDARDQMTRYLNWWEWGYLNSTGTCFDIGFTTSEALSRFKLTGDPCAGSTDPRSAGNGSMMRLAPVALYFYPSQERVIEYAAQSSRTTHAAPEAVDCCRLLAHAITQALRGKAKDQLLDGAAAVVCEPKVRDIASGHFKSKAREDIAGIGYAVDSLEAALWCVEHTSTFEEAVLAAANLGDDADTTAAITGQLAGAHYGVDAVPGEWMRTLHMSSEIVHFAERLHAVAREPYGQARPAS